MIMMKKRDKREAWGLGELEKKDRKHDKNTTYVTNVAILLIADIILVTIAHPRSEPCIVAGCLIIGPTP
jgi:hypothetical protein